MTFSLNFEIDTPIYLQLRNQILISLASGTLTPGEQLPSVRKLAEELEINMHTVNKAYLLLRDEGFISLDRRSGARIRADLETTLAGCAKILAPQLLPLAAEARCRGLGRKDFRKICGDVYDVLKDTE